MHVMPRGPALTPGEEEQPDESEPELIFDLAKTATWGDRRPWFDTMPLEFDWHLAIFHCDMGIEIPQWAYDYPAYRTHNGRV